jgi:tetratricopeptide (TPR) repeat protein
VSQRARRVAACVLATMLACACASTTPPPNATERQASALNQRAARAYAQGEYRRAAALYEQALRLDAAVENTDGMAANALSLARTWQAAGDTAAAHRALETVLAEGPLAFAPSQRAEAQARKAQLYLDAGDAAGARHWSEAALASCSDCATLAAIQTLRGRAALAAADHASALEWGARALAAAGDAQPGERANALRLLGEARTAGGEHQAAIAPLEQALALDRSLGRPALIYRDLMALGQAHLKLGERDRALAYFSRAKSVSAAAGAEADTRAANQAMEGL